MTAMLKSIAGPRAAFAVPKRVVLITAEITPVIFDPGVVAGDPPSVADCQEDSPPDLAVPGPRRVAQRPEVAGSAEAAAADCFVVEVAAAAAAPAVVAVGAVADSYLLLCTWRESDGGAAGRPAPLP